MKKTKIQNTKTKYKNTRIIEMPQIQKEIQQYIIKTKGTNNKYNKLYTNIQEYKNIYEIYTNKGTYKNANIYTTYHKINIHKNKQYTKIPNTAEIT